MKKYNNGIAENPEVKMVCRYDGWFFSSDLVDWHVSKRRFQNKKNYKYEKKC